MRSLFDHEVLECIKVFFPSKIEFGADICSWKLCNDGNFTVKSAYESLVADELVFEDLNWKLIWDNSLPPRIKNFLWLVRRGRLLTNGERARRGMSADAGCVLCGAVNESIMHVLRDCQFAQEVWVHLILDKDCQKFFDMELDAWIVRSLGGHFLMGVNGNNSNVVFAVACWFLWKQRNAFVFRQQAVTPIDIVTAVNCFAANISAA